MRPGGACRVAALKVYSMNSANEFGFQRGNTFATVGHTQDRDHLFDGFNVVRIAGF